MSGNQKNYFSSQCLETGTEQLAIKSKQSDQKGSKEIEEPIQKILSDKISQLEGIAKEGEKTDKKLGN